MRPICTKDKCNNLCKPNGYKRNGDRTYYKLCSPHLKYKYDSSYRLNVYDGYIKKERCDYCGFKCLHSCQLDIDHIDGNHENNELSNLQTLCANCHRLKTYVNRDWNRNK